VGNIRLYGSTSGYTELAPPAVAPDGVLSLPSGVGTLLTAEGGKVLQVVSASTVTQLLTTSTSYVDTNLSVTITPTKATSSIVLLISQAAYVEGASDGVANFQVLRGSTVVHEFPRSMAANAPFSATSNISLISVDSPATTSATTYKTQVKRASGTGQVGAQASNGRSYVIAMEVSA